MSDWISVSQAVAHYKVSEKTLYNRIKKNKIHSKMEHGRRWIYIGPNNSSEPTVETNGKSSEPTVKNYNKSSESTVKTNNNGSESTEPVNKSALEVKHLKEKIKLIESQISSYEEQIVGNKNQVDELLKQQDQAQQIMAMQQKTIDKLTEQNQLLLESSQEKEEKKVGFWGRLIGQRA